MATASNYTRSVVVASFQANGNEILLLWDFAQNRLVVGSRRFRKNLSVPSAGILEGWADGFNLLTPNDPYMGRTAPLTSKR